MTKFPKDYEEYFEFLDALRETGVTNMFGAVPFLMDEYPHLAYDEAHEVLVTWMKTFGERHK